MTEKIIYKELIETLKNKKVNFEMWETVDGGYCVCEYIDTYTQIQYYFDENYNYLDREEMEI